ncbi:MAG: hypothetical protein GQ580_06535 [Candidatus Thorarchaeota archaeon]|nr:hypothetical protein [Candidatus Thorarchaeota archaeon]
MKTLHIATVGEDTEMVLVGLKNVPTHRLDLICLPEHRDSVNAFALNLEKTLKIDVDVHVVEGRIVEGVLEKVADILNKHNNEFDDVVLNVAGGEKVLTCAAVTAAFFNGLKAFHLKNETPVMLPVMKVKYSDIISKAKMAVITAIHDAGGAIQSLGQLSDISGYGRPLLSYHIWGDDESRGLVKLGLVEAERGRHGRLEARLTVLGRAMVLAQSSIDR